MPLELCRDRLRLHADDIGGAGVCDGVVPLGLSLSLFVLIRYDSSILRSFPGPRTTASNRCVTDSSYTWSLLR